MRTVQLHQITVEKLANRNDQKLVTACGPNWFSS